MVSQSQIDLMGKGTLLFAAVAAVLSAGEIITSVGAAADGEIWAYTRIALGVLGLIGSALLVFGKDFGRTGWMLLVAWALVQTAYYALEPGGNYTRQLFDGLLGITQQTSVNDEVTFYEAIGINLVGVAMLIWCYRVKNNLQNWKRIGSVQ